MGYHVIATLLALGLFGGMLLAMEIGRRLGIRWRSRDGEEGAAGAGAVDGAIFGLMGLLVAFTFSGAAARFDARRQLIVEEANDIGTAYLRIDLMPPNAQPALRESFRRYVDVRLAMFANAEDVAAVTLELANATKLQGEIWSQAVAACPDAQRPACMLLLPALNAMIDITTTRAMAALTHPPAIIFAMLFGVMLASSLLAGFGMVGGNAYSWAHMLTFAALMTVAFYVILDLEYPRLGLIRVDAFDTVLVQVRHSMQ